MYIKIMSELRKLVVLNLDFNVTAVMEATFIN